MGYPMNYKRVINRNQLTGDYDSRNQNDLRNNSQKLIAGDLRRLESDCRDIWHLRRYAETTGLTPEQVKKVLDVFFGDVELKHSPMTPEERERLSEKGFWNVSYDYIPPEYK